MRAPIARSGSRASIGLSTRWPRTGSPCCRGEEKSPLDQRRPVPLFPENSATLHARPTAFNGGSGPVRRGALLLAGRALEEPARPAPLLAFVAAVGGRLGRRAVGAERGDDGGRRLEALGGVALEAAQDRGVPAGVE